MTTTIAPALGHAPLFTQAGTGASPGYDFLDFRRALSAGLQEGVMGAQSFEVTQRASGGANMSVDIAASAADASGSGVAALVQGDGIVQQGLYPVPPHTGVINEAITSNASGFPRVDQVVLELRDDTHDGSLANDVRVRVVAGTGASGATLNNRTGAANLATACPGGCLLLADVLVANGASSIANSSIRDRRKWARGAKCLITRNSNAAAGTNYSFTSTTFALLDSVNIAPRIECSGVPVRVRLVGTWNANVATDILYFSPQVDGAGVNGMASVGASPVSNALLDAADTISVRALKCDWTFTPAAGSHIIAPAFARLGAALTFRASAAQPLLWSVEELLGQSAVNNATTTG